MEKPPDLESQPTPTVLPDETTSQGSTSTITDKGSGNPDADMLTAAVVVDFELMDTGNPRNWKSSTKWAINLGVSQKRAFHVSIPELPTSTTPQQYHGRLELIRLSFLSSASYALLVLLVYWRIDRG
jgi:hypothetical protein